MNTATLSELRATQLAPRNDSMPVVMGFETSAGFELMQRVGKMFAGSKLVPEVYRGNLADCIIAVNMASRMRADPLMIMQNLYIVHGNPGWSAKFLIACWNQCGRYTTIRYEFTGKQNTDEWTCRAWSTELATGEKVIGPAVSIKMAREEGWSTKNGSKWKSIPELMMTYRAAAFLVRTHAPELAMGLPTVDELQDTIDARQGADGAFTVDLDTLRGADPAQDATQTAPEVQPHSEPADAPSSPDSEAPSVSYAQVATALQKSKSPETLEVAADLIGSVEDAAHRAELSAMYEARKVAIAGAAK